MSTNYTANILILTVGKTRTELLSKIHTRLIPHPTYDLNRDGYVSQQDYKIAKRFDIGISTTLYALLIIYLS